MTASRFTEGAYVEIVNSPGCLYSVIEITESGTVVLGEISSIDGDWVQKLTVERGDIVEASEDTLDAYQSVI